MGMYANAILELMKVKCQKCSEEFWLFPKGPQDLMNPEHDICIDHDVNGEPNLIHHGENLNTQEDTAQ